MKISISALSIAYSLTPEALRYYEEKGLLAPERTASSGFRKFSFEDIKRLGIIKSMQRQGFSLEEIKTIVTGCTQQELIAMMDEKRVMLREQITMSNAILSRLTAGSDLLRDSALLDMKPRLCTGCAAYVHDFESFQEMWRCVPTSPLLRSLIDALPLTSYCTIVPRAAISDRETELRAGICAPAEYLAAIQADFSQLRMCAGPRSVRIVYELSPPAKTSIRPALSAARAFLQEHALTPVCDGYTREYAWFVEADGRKRHFSELIIPVAD